MNDKGNSLPFLLKSTIFLLGIFALFTMLFIAKEIIVPIIFAFMIAIVLHPIVTFLVGKKINRVVAIILTLVVTFIIIAAIGALIVTQAVKFNDSWPILVDKFTSALNQSVNWVSEYFNIKHYKINEWVAKTKGELINISSAEIGQTLLSVGNALVVLFLIPIYVFMILFYKPLILDFIKKLFDTGNLKQVNEIFTQTKSVIQRYILGLVIEAVIIATLNILGLLILGIDYAILLGIIGALLNIIPYIGGIIGVLLFMAIALVTKSPVYVVYVLVLYSVIQLIDNNYIVPKIVASKVKINALFSIIVVIAGNALWGIPGMFLSIPLLAIIKVIFDHIEPLKPWGFLFGDTMPPILKIHPIIKKIQPIFKIKIKAPKV